MISSRDCPFLQGAASRAALRRELQRETARLEGEPQVLGRTPSQRSDQPHFDRSPGVGNAILLQLWAGAVHAQRLEPAKPGPGAQPLDDVPFIVTPAWRAGIHSSRQDMLEDANLHDRGLCDA